jgi:hypothetical protein
VGREYATARGGLYALANEAIARLPETLGADRYATLSAVGAAMTAAQILDHAKQHTTRPGTAE